MLDRLRSALAGRYTIERELGAGGMATVYLAQDMKHHRKVAVKVLRPEIAATLGAERFSREIDVAAQLQHPHILPLLDSGEADGFFYYVMPFVEGQSLRDRLAHHGELPVHDAVKVLIEVVDALAHAHAHGVVHRDIKPDNVMLSGRHALVTDFGVAKAVSEATGAHTLTSVGVALGTPAYMAPEQAAADPHLDHRVDLYAVGVLGYELLTGRPPFAGLTPQETLAAHVTQQPEPVTKHRPEITPALSGVLMKCLAKRPADRWQSADELLAQLEPLSTPSSGITPTGTQPFWITQPGRRPRTTVVAAAALLLVLGVVLVLRSRGTGRATDGTAAGDTAPSVAVLPFTDMTLQPGQEYFADGLTDEVIVALSKVPGLRVPGHASSFYFKNSRTALWAIADSLHVRTLLTGTVQRAGNRVRVRAQLVNAADGFQLWSETYERGLQDLFAVYDDLARAISGALQVKLGAATERGAARRGSPNAQAYNEYLHGQFYLTNRQIDSALPHLERAVAADSTFALAWSALSMAHLLSTPAQYKIPGVTAQAGLRAGEQAVRHALRLDSASAEAHTAAAFLANLTWRWDDAEREFQAAIALNPSYARARHWHAILLLQRGRSQEALTEVRAAEALDPLSWIIGVWVGSIAWVAGEREFAQGQMDRLIALNPSVARLRGDAALLRVRAGDFTEAARRYAEFAELRYGDSTLARRWRDELARPDRRPFVAAEIADSLETVPSPGSIDLLMYTGNRSRALAVLRSWTIERGAVAPDFMVRITHPDLRRTLAFQAILRTMGLPL